jgi:hypothetical protein
MEGLDTQHSDQRIQPQKKDPSNTKVCAQNGLWVLPGFCSIHTYIQPAYSNSFFFSLHFSHNNAHCVDAPLPPGTVHNLQINQCRGGMDGWFGWDFGGLGILGVF